MNSAGRFSYLAIVTVVLLLWSNLIYAGPRISSISAAAGCSIDISPQTVTANVGDIVTFNLTVSSAVDLYAWQVCMHYRSIILDLLSVVEGDFLKSGGNTTFVFSTQDKTPSVTPLYVGCSLTGDVPGVDGSGLLATLRFNVTNGNTTYIQLHHSNEDWPTSLLNDYFKMMDYSFVHDSAEVDVNAPAVFMLNVVAPSYGRLNITAGYHTCDGGKNISIQATEEEGAFRYFQLDDARIPQKLLKLNMTASFVSTDHDLTAVFQIPRVAIHTSVGYVHISNIGMWLEGTDANGNLNISLARGTYHIRASKNGYYDSTYTLDLKDDASITLTMYQAFYCTPSGGSPTVYGTVLTLQSMDIDYRMIPFYYVDFDRLIYCEPVTGTVGNVVFRLCYNTSYPTIAITARNIRKIDFNITRVYQRYFAENYTALMQGSNFTGIQLDTNASMLLKIRMPFSPLLVLKASKWCSNATIYSSWSYVNDTLILTTQPCMRAFSLLFSPPVFRARMPNDLNGDGRVDISDIAIITKAFGSYSGHAKWNPIADEDEDGAISIIDVATVMKTYGKTY